MAADVKISEKEKKLKSLMASATGCDRSIYENIIRRFDEMGKPLSSLGKLETNVAAIGAAQHKIMPDIKRRALVVMCADNGIVDEGVTQTDRRVTATVAENFFDDLTCTSIMCKKAGCDIRVIDIGMAADTPRTLRLKSCYGSRNFTTGPAMTRDEAAAAVLSGIKMAETLSKEGFGIIATGEMGIGNTTTSSAVASVLLKRQPCEMTGRGAGLSSRGLQRKIDAIERGIKVNAPDERDALDVLSKVGGFDIAGLSGIFIGGAVFGVPILIDGFISSVAALVAVRLCPAASDYMIATHISKEPAMGAVLEALGKEAMLCCDMCLGEGSGAVAALPLLDMAIEVYEKMGTFEDIRVEAYRHLE